MNKLLLTLSQTTGQVSLAIIVLDILLAAACALILAWFYNQYGLSLSNRQRLSRNFLPIAITTALIITVVKSSLALSLGLVGALSIVRFRSAIKEPEELAYLFLAISLGLGFGANQHAVTLVAFFLILFLMWIQVKFKGLATPPSLFLSLSLPGKNKTALKEIVAVLNPYCKKIDVKRLDKDKDILEVALAVEFIDATKVDEAVASLTKLNKNAKVSLVDQNGILV
jgi:hypothetical protein